MTSGRVLVAGVGNIFLGDDGVGVEVARHLVGRPLPDGVEVVDVGIRGEAPGTVSVIEVGPGDVTTGPDLIDAHGLAPVRAAVPEAVRLIETILSASGGARDARQIDQVGTGGNPGGSRGGDGEPGDTRHQAVHGNITDVRT